MLYAIKDAYDSSLKLSNINEIEKYIKGEFKEKIKEKQF